MLIGGRLSQTAHTINSGLFGLVEGRGYSILGDHIDDCSPARVHVSVASSSYYLVQLERQLLLFHPLPVVRLTYRHQLLTARTRALKPFNLALSAYRIVTRQDRLTVL